MYTVVTIAAWKLVILFVCVFGAGWVMGRLESTYNFDEEDDEDEES